MAFPVHGRTRLWPTGRMEGQPMVGLPHGRTSACPAQCMASTDHIQHRQGEVHTMAKLEQPMVSTDHFQSST